MESLPKYGPANSVSDAVHVYTVWQSLSMNRRRGGGVIIFVSCLALAAACPPPDMSTLVKSWPYRELYGLIRAPLRWHRARHVFVRLGEVRHRERRRQWHASKSPSVWSAGNFSFWGAGRQQAWPIPSQHTVRAKLRPTKKKLRPTKKGQWRRAEGQLSDFERSGRQI